MILEENNPLHQNNKKAASATSSADKKATTESQLCGVIFDLRCFNREENLHRICISSAVSVLRECVSAHAECADVNNNSSGGSSSNSRPPIILFTIVAVTDNRAEVLLAPTPAIEEQCDRIEGALKAVLDTKPYFIGPRNAPPPAFSSPHGGNDSSSSKAARSGRGMIFSTSSSASSAAAQHLQQQQQLLQIQQQLNQTPAMQAVSLLRSAADLLFNSTSPSSSSYSFNIDSALTFIFSTVGLAPTPTVPASFAAQKGALGFPPTTTLQSAVTTASAAATASLLLLPALATMTVAQAHHHSHLRGSVLAFAVSERAKQVRKVSNINNHQCPAQQQQQPAPPIFALKSRQVNNNSACSSFTFFVSPPDPSQFRRCLLGPLSRAFHLAQILPAFITFTSSLSSSSSSSSSSASSSACASFAPAVHDDDWGESISASTSTSRRRARPGETSSSSASTSSATTCCGRGEDAAGPARPPTASETVVCVATSVSLRRNVFDALDLPPPSFNAEQHHQHPQQQQKSLSRLQLSALRFVSTTSVDEAWLQGTAVVLRAAAPMLPQTNITNNINNNYNSVSMPKQQQQTQHQKNAANTATPTSVAALSLNVDRFHALHEKLFNNNHKNNNARGEQFLLLVQINGREHQLGLLFANDSDRDCLILRRLIPFNSFRFDAMQPQQQTQQQTSAKEGGKDFLEHAADHVVRPPDHEFARRMNLVPAGAFDVGGFVK